MRRITISVEESLARQFDALIEQRGYHNRSEAFRDLLRGQIESERKETDNVHFCVGTLSYVYNHHERELASRLASFQHEHHDVCISTMHVHLDHDQCLETVILSGHYRAVRAFADATIAQSGVRHGNLHIVPADTDTPPVGRHQHRHIHPTT